MEIVKSQDTYSQIALLIKEAQFKVRREVNSVMVLTYWNVGKIIVEDELGGRERAEYGKQTLKELSERLTIEFGSGFDLSNLKRMRKFYNLFPIGATVRHQLTWSHYKFLVKIENKSSRDWYMNQASEENWSTRALERQMDMYIRIFEEKMRGEGDNPTIGLILCSEKNEAVAKYSMLSESKQLFASKYKLLLPTEEQLEEELRKDLLLIDGGE